MTRQSKLTNQNLSFMVQAHQIVKTSFTVSFTNSTFQSKFLVDMLFANIPKLLKPNFSINAFQEESQKHI